MTQFILQIVANGLLSGMVYRAGRDRSDRIRRRISGHDRASLRTRIMTEAA